jgi:hypothetical protein
LPVAVDVGVVAVVVVAVAHLVPAVLLRVALLPLRRGRLRPVVLPRAAHLLLALAAVDVAADAGAAAQW